ncbi:MAG: (2Fe-2S)-binding protein [Bacteriovoracaceae bacterium]|jgi:ferredoxin|nr:(2Fe-2S)-binding protein [Bacteriovoracaceae bacterium]
MMKLRIKDSDISIEIIDKEQNLLSALLDEKIYVKSSCGGHASCSDCMIKIVSGEDNLTPPPFEEINLLGNVFHITKERLACQTKITGDITIDISHHDETADQKKLKNKKHNTKSQSRVRKQAEVKEILDERKASSEEKTKARDEKDNSYFEHWKKEKDPDAPPRKLDGGNRPMPFVTPEKEPQEEKQATSDSDQQETLENVDEVDNNK